MREKSNAREKGPYEIIVVYTRDCVGALPSREPAATVCSMQWPGLGQTEGTSPADLSRVCVYQACQVALKSTLTALLVMSS